MIDSSGLRIEIRIKGHLDRDWSDWLGGLAIICGSDGNTILTGVIPNQAALYGLLSQLSSLGIQLISVLSEKKQEEIRRRKYEG